MAYTYSEEGLIQNSNFYGKSFQQINLTPNNTTGGYLRVKAGTTIEINIDDEREFLDGVCIISGSLSRVGIDTLDGYPNGEYTLFDYDATNKIFSLPSSYPYLSPDTTHTLCLIPKKNIEVIDVYMTFYARLPQDTWTISCPNTKVDEIVKITTNNYISAGGITFGTLSPSNVSVNSSTGMVKGLHAVLSVTLTAYDPGNDYYLARYQTTSILVSKGDPAITVNVDTPILTRQSTTITAYANSGGTIRLYNSTPTIISLNGSTVLGLAPGNGSINVTVSSTDDYESKTIFVTIIVIQDKKDCAIYIKVNGTMKEGAIYRLDKSRGYFKPATINYLKNRSWKEG